MSDDMVKAKVNGVEKDMDLAELAELDVTDMVAAFGGFTKTPPSVALWRVASWELVATKNGNPMFNIEIECMKPYAINDDSMTMEDMVEFKHIERFVIKDVNEDMKKVIGFLQVIGLANTNGKLTALLDQAVGLAFVALIKHSRNKDDPDNPYVNMDIKGIKTQAAYEALSV